MTTIAVITGNPKPNSRTHSVAVAVSDLLAKETGESSDRIVIDLANYAPRLFDWSDPELTRLTAEVAAADIAIFASPTYKATYTGLLKLFLDRFPGEFEAHVSKQAKPAEIPLIAELRDIEGDEAVLDERHRGKQFDWSYDAEDSGQAPADRLDDHRNPRPLEG